MCRVEKYPQVIPCCPGGEELMQQEVDLITVLNKFTVKMQGFFCFVFFQVAFLNLMNETNT